MVDVSMIFLSHVWFYSDIFFVCITKRTQTDSYVVVFIRRIRRFWVLATKQPLSLLYTNVCSWWNSSSSTTANSRIEIQTIFAWLTTLQTCWYFTTSFYPRCTATRSVDAKTFITLIYSIHRFLVLSVYFIVRYRCILYTIPIPGKTLYKSVAIYFSQS